ncbi:MAG: FecR family protein [Gammaproteobacteria bacterium]|nr:FecR family protein [Gammaproteobacteria bacterium]MBU2677358.1 FecR family protein [Gammaproteobacteria bacterium]NNC57757.1 FecR domain-containing protein [Woeseiaceae bacterium]NNL51089.1 FecR domain-containing protein [Woeseiaceae bacterium]
MSNFNQSTDLPSDDALEQLLRRASPRPMPPQADEASVREAVRTEWRKVSSKHRTRRRMASLAVAATVVLGVFAAFNLLRVPGVEAVQVAAIEKSIGSIYLLGDSSELRETRDLSSVLSGQTIVTGDQAGIALAWGAGGSMRMDENTRLEFIDNETVYLKAGRIYFDSRPSSLIAGVADAERLVVRTDHGEVAHLGTQFVTGVDDRALTVSVREGQVSIDGQYHRHVASSGEQVTFSGRQRPTVLSISRAGEGWNWVSQMSPSPDVDGKPLYEFLLWACRELGLEIHWEGQAEQVAHAAILKGSIDSEPAEAMRLRLASADLEWRINDGVIYVSDN